MYWQVYLHKTVLSAELMLKEALRRLSTVAKAGSSSFGVSDALNFFLIRDVETSHFEDAERGVLQKFAQLDDFDIVSALKGGASSSDKILKYLCVSLLDRNLFKLRFSAEPIPIDEVVTLRNQARLKFNIEGSSAEHLVIHGIESNSAYVAEQDEIKILYKDGRVKPLSTTVDFGVESKRIEKTFLAYPRELT